MIPIIVHHLVQGHRVLRILRHLEVGVPIHQADLQEPEEGK